MEEIITNTTHVYKYRHTNGTVLAKSVYVVESFPGGPEKYFESPYVQEWWLEKRDDPPTVGGFDEYKN